MPSLPDIPAKGLVAGSTERARALAIGAGGAALTVGGFVLKRVLGQRGDERIDADPIAETPTAPPTTSTTSERSVLKPRPPRPVVVKPRPAKPEAERPKPAKPEAAKPAPPKPEVDKPKAGKPEAGKPAPPKPAAGNPKPGRPAGDRPKPSKPVADKPKPSRAKPAKPKPSKPSGARSARAKAVPKKAKPPTTTGTDAPPNPEVEPGNISADRDHPHRALSSPVVDPDET